MAILHNANMFLCVFVGLASLFTSKASEKGLESGKQHLPAVYNVQTC